MYANVQGGGDKMCKDGGKNLNKKKIKKIKKVMIFGDLRLKIYGNIVQLPTFIYSTFPFEHVFQNSINSSIALTIFPKKA